MPFQRQSVIERRATRLHQIQRTRAGPVSRPLIQGGSCQFLHGFAFQPEQRIRKDL